MNMHILNNKYINICNLYLALWSLYYIQGIFYPMGSIIPRTCLVFTMLITIAYWVKATINFRLPPPLRMMNILVIVLLVYALIYQIKGNFAIRKFDGEIYTGIGAVRSLIVSLLPIFPVLIFTIKGYLNRTSVRIWTVIFLIVITFQFFAYEFAKKAVSIYHTDGLTNNIAYYFVAVIPMVLLFSKKKIIMYSILLYIMFFLVYGMKRGAILIGALIIVYIIVKDFKSSTIVKKMLIIILVTGVAIFIFNYIEKLASSSSYFQYRLEKTLSGDSSGRDSYYETFWNTFVNEISTARILFGGGYYNTVKINGNLAHNDWLELLINQGLFGLSLFFIYCVTWIKYVTKIRNTECFPIIICCLGIFIFKSIISMAITETLIYGMLPIGYCLGRLYLNKKL